MEQSKDHIVEYQALTYHHNAIGKDVDIKFDMKQENGEVLRNVVSVRGQVCDMNVTFNDGCCKVCHRVDFPVESGREPVWLDFAEEGVNDRLHWPLWSITAPQTDWKVEEEEDDMERYLNRPNRPVEGNQEDSDVESDDENSSLSRNSSRGNATWKGTRLEDDQVKPSSIETRDDRSCSDKPKRIFPARLAQENAAARIRRAGQSCHPPPELVPSTASVSVAIASAGSTTSEFSTSPATSHEEIGELLSDPVAVQAILAALPRHERYFRARKILTAFLLEERKANRQARKTPASDSCKATTATAPLADFVSSTPTDVVSEASCRVLPIPSNTSTGAAVASAKASGISPTATPGAGGAREPAHRIPENDAKNTSVSPANIAPLITGLGMQIQAVRTNATAKDKFKATASKKRKASAFTKIKVPGTTTTDTTNKRRPRPNVTRQIDGCLPEWFAEFHNFLTDVKHGPKNEVCSKTNVGRISSQVKKLLLGKGITYKNWPAEKYFKKGKIFTLDSDYEKLGQEAKDFEMKYGEDVGHGWVLKHPIKKLLLFQQWKVKQIRPINRLESFKNGKDISSKDCAQA
jgi:hypothetical protein